MRIDVILGYLKRPAILLELLSPLKHLSIPFYFSLDLLVVLMFNEPQDFISFIIGGFDSFVSTTVLRDLHAKCILAILHSMSIQVVLLLVQEILRVAAALCKGK